MSVVYSTNRVAGVVIHLIYKFVCLLDLLQYSLKSWHLNQNLNSDSKCFGLACCILVAVPLLPQTWKLELNHSLSWKNPYEGEAGMEFSSQYPPQGGS